MKELSWIQRGMLSFSKKSVELSNKPLNELRKIEGLSFADFNKVHYDCDVSMVGGADGYKYLECNTCKIESAKVPWKD